MLPLIEMGKSAEKKAEVAFRDQESHLWNVKFEIPVKQQIWVIQVVVGYIGLKPDGEISTFTEFAMLDETEKSFVIDKTDDVRTLSSDTSHDLT